MKVKLSYEKYLSYHFQEEDISAFQKAIEGKALFYYDRGCSKMTPLGQMKEKFNSVTKHGLNEKEKIALKYVEENNLLYDIILQMEGWYYLQYSEFCLIASSSLVTLIEEPDYSEIPIQELRAMIGTKNVMPMAPAVLSDQSIKNMEDKKSQLRTAENALREKEKRIQDAAEGELKEIKAKMEKLQTELQEKQKALLQELAEKQLVLEQEMARMNREIYLLKSEIYTIRCYMGETVDLVKIRSGRKANIETPVVLNQKIMYLDEDLPRLCSIYLDEIDKNIRVLEDVLRYSEKAFASFCPQEKCVTFFRLSKKNRGQQFAFSFVDKEQGVQFWETYSLLHGKKIGFAIRDGEELYVGWLEKEWDKGASVTFEGELMYRPKTIIEQVDDDVNKHYSGLEGEKTDSANERISRLFAITILQGILENKQILSLPEKVDLKCPSKYVVHNYADAWLEDDRFADLSILAENLQEYNRRGDDIIVIQDLQETSYQRGTNDRGIGYANRTHDCKVESGLHKLNKISGKSICISVEKAESDTGARSNFLVYSDEYINITYMCSPWLKYYLHTKKLGNIRQDYSYYVRYLKIALDFILKREEHERMLIEPYYPGLMDILDWQEKLSHWKIWNGIREITDFQAKRFAKYLAQGKYKRIAHLFEKQPSMKIPFYEVFSYTRMSDIYRSYPGPGYSMSDNSDQEFGPGTKYSEWGLIRKDPFFSYERPKTPEEEILARLPRERKKLKKVQEYLQKVLREKKVSMEEILQWLSENRRAFVDEYMKHAEYYFQDCIDITTLTFKSWAELPKGVKKKLEGEFSPRGETQEVFELVYGNYLMHICQEFIFAVEYILHERYIYELL